MLCYINHYFLKTVQLFKFVIIANEENILFPVGYGTQPGNPSNSVNSQISYPFYFVPNHIHHGYLDRRKLANCTERGLGWSPSRGNFGPCLTIQEAFGAIYLTFSGKLFHGKRAHVTRRCTIELT